MLRNTESSTHSQITQLLAKSEELIAQAQGESEQQLPKKLSNWNIAHGYMSLLMDALDRYTRNLSSSNFAADYPNWINQILIQLKQLTQDFDAFKQLPASVAAKWHQDLTLVNSWRDRLFFLIENSPCPENFLRHYQYIMEADWEKLSDWLSNETTFSQVLNACLAGLHVSEQLTQSEPLATELFKNWLTKLAAIKYYVELGNYFIAGFSAATLSSRQLVTEKAEFYFQRIGDLVQLLHQAKLEEQAVSFINMNKTVFQQADKIFSLNYAERSCGLLLRNSDSVIPINLNLLEDRKALAQVREYYYKTLLSNTENTYQLQQGLSNDIQQLVAVILQRCLAWLGPAPITFCIIKLGSGARADSNFYSDLECALVLAKKIDSNNQTWFEHLIKLFHFHMTCFGERLGFRLDEGGDLRDETSIGTIEELLQRNFTYDNDSNKLESPLTASLLNPAFLFGCDEGKTDQDTQAKLLLQDFQKQIYAEQQKIISLPDKPSRSLQRLRAQAFLTTHVDIILKKNSEWNFTLDTKTDLYFDLKKHFIQPLTCLLLDLAWYYDWSFTTIAKFFNDYEDNGFNQLFTVTFFKELIAALQQAQRLRLLAHYQAKYQQDRVSVVSDNNSLTASDHYLLNATDWHLILNLRSRILEPLTKMLRHSLKVNNNTLPTPANWDPAIDYYKKITAIAAPILGESIDWNSAIYSLISTLWIRQAEKKQYRDYYRMLPDEKRPLFITALIQIGETLASVHADSNFLASLLEQLKWIPTATGERTAVLEKRKAWEQRLYNMTDVLDSSKIKVQWITPNGIVTRSLKPEIAQQIIDEQGKLKPRLKEIPGRRWARPLATQHWNSYDELKEQNIIAFVKQPELPGMQVSIETLIHRLSGLAGYSTPVRVFLPQQTKPLVLLFSNYSGKTLLTLRSEKADAFDTLEKMLDPYAFTMKHFETRVVVPGDDKDDNITSQSAVMGEGDSLQLICFDNEQGLLDAVVKNDFLEEKLEVKTLVYLLTAMNNPICEESIADILHLDAAALLRAWLVELQFYNDALFNDDAKQPGLFTLKEIQTLANDKNENERCFLPAFLITGDLARLYKAIQRHQNLLQEPATLENHWNPLHYQEQKLGHYYEKAYKKENNLYDRFDSLPTKHKKIVELGDKNNPIAYHQSLVGKPQERVYASLSVVNEKKRKNLKEALKNDLATALRDNLKKCQTTELEPLITYYNQITQIQNDLYNGKLSSFIYQAEMAKFKVEDYIKEKILKHLNWLQVVPAPSAKETTEQYQQAILKTIVKKSRKTEFNELIFENCVGLTDNILKKLLNNSPALTRITLIACPLITKEALSILITHAPLQTLELKALPQLIQVKTKRGDWKHLRRLYIRDCVAIAAIEMDVPLLQHLLLQQLKELKILRIQGPSWLNSTIVDCPSLIISELPQVKAAKVPQAIASSPKKLNSSPITKSKSFLKLPISGNANLIKGVPEKCLTLFDDNMALGDNNFLTFLTEKYFDTFCLIGNNINFFNGNYVENKEYISFYQVDPNKINALDIQCLIKLWSDEDSSPLLEQPIFWAKNYVKHRKIKTKLSVLAKTTFKNDEWMTADVLVFCVSLDPGCLEKLKIEMENVQQCFILLKYSKMPIPVIIVGLGIDKYNIQEFAKITGAEYLMYVGHESTWLAITDIAAKYKLQARRERVFPEQSHSVSALPYQLYLYSNYSNKKYQKQLLRLLQDDQCYSEIHISGNNINAIESFLTTLLKTNSAITDIRIRDIQVKCVVIGSGGVGKTALITQYIQRYFLQKYEMTMQDYHYKLHPRCDLEISDVRGADISEIFSRMRDIHIIKGDVFILAYSITTENTFNDIEALYKKILSVKESANVPCILVGMKSDLPEQRVVSYKDGANLAAKLGMVFMECSAKTVEGPDKVFETAIKLVLKVKEKLAINSAKELKYSFVPALKLNQELHQRFYTSIVSGNLEQVKQCLTDGVSLYAPLHDKETALHVAMRAGNLEIAEILLEHCVANRFALFAQNYFSDISSYIADPNKKAYWKLLFLFYERQLNQAIFYSNTALPHIQLASPPDIKSNSLRERSKSLIFWKSSSSESTSATSNLFLPILQEKCLTLFDEELTLENNEDRDIFNKKLQNYNALFLIGNDADKLIKLAEMSGINALYQVNPNEIKNLSICFGNQITSANLNAQIEKDRFYSSLANVTHLKNISIKPTIITSGTFQLEVLKKLDVIVIYIKADEINYENLIKNTVNNIKKQFASLNYLTMPIPLAIINTGQVSDNIHKLARSMDAEYIQNSNLSTTWQYILKIAVKYKLQAYRVKLSNNYSFKGNHNYNPITHPSQLYLSTEFITDKKYQARMSALLAKDQCYKEIYIQDNNVNEAEIFFTPALKTNHAITDIIVHNRDVKCVVLGSSGVGKTALVKQYVQRYFPQKYEKTIEDSYRKLHPFCYMEILDTGGFKTSANLQDLYEKNDQVFILVYSITSQNTFNTAANIYDQILRLKNDYYDSDNAPTILVGMKNDLNEQRVISHEQGKNLATKFGMTFIECSAKTLEGPNKVFETAIQLAFKAQFASLRAKQKPILNTVLELNRALLRSYYNAILAGNTAALIKHLDEGVSLYAPLDYEKNTALHLAVKNEQRDITEILLKYFVKQQYSFFMKNDASQTAIDFIAKLPSDEQATWGKLFKQYECLLNQTIFINNNVLPPIADTPTPIATDHTSENSFNATLTLPNFWRTTTERKTKLQQFQQKIKPLLDEKIAFNLLISAQQPESLFITLLSNTPFPQFATTALNALQTALSIVQDHIEGMQLQQNCLVVRSISPQYTAELKRFLGDAGFENKEPLSNSNVTTAEPYVGFL